MRTKNDDAPYPLFNRVAMMAIAMILVGITLQVFCTDGDPMTTQAVADPVCPSGWAFLDSGDCMGAEPVDELADTDSELPAVVFVELLPPEQPVYVVQSGDTLEDIAHIYGVTWRDIYMLNALYLRRVNAARCAEHDANALREERLARRAERTGRYCNFAVQEEGEPMVWANSLQPGDTLHIPPVVNPHSL